MRNPRYPYHHERNIFRKANRIERAFKVAFNITATLLFMVVVAYTFTGGF